MSRYTLASANLANTIALFCFGSLVMVLPACGAAGVEYTGFIVEDSAGVRIVTSTISVRDPALPVWTVADAPSWSIGSTDGPEAQQFTRVLNAWVSDGGNMLVVEDTTSTARSLYSDGEVGL